MWDKSSAAEVSVFVVTFNHEKFVARCVESILEQKTNFPVRLTVYDDASTDDTPTILKEYEAAYPNVVSVICGTVNQYSKSKFLYYYNEVCGCSDAPYVARCGGDDFWGDPLKLQNQHDYLEAHPEVVITGHDCLVVDEAGQQLAGSLIPVQDQRDVDRECLIRNKLWISGTTVVHRNVLREFPPEFGLSMHNDSWLWSLLGHHGKYHFHHDIAPAGYRKHAGGIWSQRSKQVQQAEWTNSMYWLYRYYQRIGQQRYADHFLEMHADGCLVLADTQRLFKAAWHRATSPLTWGGALKKWGCPTDR